jgi:beta-carotene 3-hydroxylase
MTLLVFSFWTAAGFVGLELVSYVLHRWVFHGLLWRVHRTHHTARHGLFEWNDLFSVAFASAAIALLILGLGDPLGSIAFPTGLGITLYGLCYFVVHDLYTHKRYLPFSSENRVLQVLKRAHLRHHQSAEKPGREPFGLFLFAYGKFIQPPAKRNAPDAAMPATDALESHH